jgi:type IV secretion system protein VirB2
MKYRHCAPLAAVPMLLALVLLASSEPVLAQSIGGNGSLPWDTFTQRLACMLSGAWVKWVAVIAIAIGGVMYGLGELSGPFSRVMQIGGGFSVAAGAVTVAGWLLGAGTGSCA